MKNNQFVFISYSHGNDDKWRDRLFTHLEGLAWTKSQMNVFVDIKLWAGARLEQEIINAIDQTAVAVLLLSPDFLKSRYVQEVELPRFLARHQKTGMPIVPIVVEPCAWQETEIANLLVRPRETAQPLSQFSVREQQKILVDLAQEINHLYVRQIEQDDQITVVVADDREFTLRGLKDVFEDDYASDMVVVGLAPTVSDTERALIDFAPDILLLDLSWYRDDTAGFRIIDRANYLSPRTKIIAISNHSDLLEKAHNQGVPTLDKDFTIVELFNYIRQVHNAPKDLGAEKLLFELLTDRELEVLRLAAAGYQDKEIKDRLVVSLSTVKKHMSNLLAKTKMRTRTEAAVKAKEFGII